MAREVRTELRRRILYFVQGIVITKQVEKKGTKDTAKPQMSTRDKVQGRASRVSKPRPKAATRLATTKAPNMNSLTAAMAGSIARVKSTSSTSSSNNVPPTPQTASASPAQTTTTTPLFLNCNGVPKIRIAGATEEEKRLNEDLQGVGRLGPTGGLVSFDVRRGDVVGVRVGGRMYGRILE